MVPIALLVEEVAPTERFGRVSLRVSQYLKAGVSVVIQLHPEDKAITVYRIGKQFECLEAGDELSEEGFPAGFRCKVAEFFE